MTTSAVALAESIRRKELSASEAVAAAIDRIERSDARINAVVTPLFERALTRAGDATGPFAGVPMLLKDAGQELAGTPHFVGLAALRDAGSTSTTTTALAAKFEALGFVIVGKSACPALSTGVTTEPAGFAPTRNPWNEGRTVGGSSGGSAAAVAAGMVPIAHGSDATGSLRFPASACGVVTLRPSVGRIASVPPAGLGDDLGVWREFVVARDVDDLAALFALLASPRLVARRRLRIGLLAADPLLGTPPDPACVDAVVAAGRLLESLGHSVEESWPAALEGLPGRLAAPSSIAVDVSRAVQFEWVAQRLGRSPTAEELPPGAWDGAARGRHHPAVAIDASTAIIRSLVEPVLAWWDRFDVLVTPTMRRAPWPLGEAAGPLHCGMFAAPFSFTGQPSMNLPLHVDSEDLPVGVQVVGAVGDDELLLDLAAQLQVTAGWNLGRVAGVQST